MSKSIRLRWKLAGLLGVVLAVGVLAIAYRSRIPTYEATAWLELRSGNAILPEERFRFEATHRELMRSQPVFEAVLANPDISSLPVFEDVKSPVNWLRSKLTVRLLPGSNLLTVSIRDSHQESVAPLVNAVCRAYLSSIDWSILSRNKQLLDDLEAERNRRAAAIEQVRAEDREKEKAVLGKITARIEAIKRESVLQGPRLVQEATRPLKPTDPFQISLAMSLAGIAFFVPFAPLLLWEIFLRAAAEMVEFVTRRKRETIILGKDT